MPGPNPFEDFEFPEPIELEPLLPYEGVENNYGGYEDVYGGEYGNTPRLEVEHGEGFGGDGDLRAFRAYNVNDDTTGWRCYITAGIVIENHIRNQGYTNSCDLGSSGEYETSSKVYIPTINGVDIVDPQCGSAGSAWSRPWLTLPDPPDPAYVYCRYETDTHGHITGNVTIEAYSTEKKSIHHIPSSPEDAVGQTGEYYILLNELCQDTTESVLVSHRFQSNILWQEAFVVENESGEGSRVYRRFDCVRDSIKLRRVKGCYGLTDLETDQNVQLDFHGQNIGEAPAVSGAVTAEVYADSTGNNSCGEPAKFRRLTVSELYNPPHIYPIEDGDRIQLRGNGVNRKLRWFRCGVPSYTDANADFIMVWEDGLLTNKGAGTNYSAYNIVAGCDSSGAWSPPT